MSSPQSNKYIHVFRVEGKFAIGIAGMPSADIIKNLVPSSFRGIVFTVVLMVAVIGSSPVWSWINDDEEEDTVRFRQRLVFVVFWFVAVGLLHFKAER